MNFLHMSYLPGLLVVLGLFIAIILLMEKRFFRLVEQYWFYKRSLFSWLSTLCFIAGMTLLLGSLLDARGPEERVKTPVPKDRTIILIDTSASMLAEDVKPSRLQKATLVAKHFARKAAGHSLSIVAFAEIQKKIVPFTNDLDLIDARLDSVKNLRNQYGSSALSVAIQESIQYFRESDGEARGNILVLTDGEETSEGIDFKVPKEIHVAFVGVGTSQGGRIPLDDGRGFRFGYKKDKGRDVITKLNEDFFKAAVKDIPSAQYWLANTYSLPSEDIVEFFSGEKEKSKEQQDMVIRPVMMEWIVIPAIIFFILSWMFKAIKVFTLGSLLFLMPWTQMNSYAQQEEPKVELSPKVIQKLQALEKGELNKLEKIKLADDLHKAGEKEQALALYDEQLSGAWVDENIPKDAYFNYGTALLEQGDVARGLDTYYKLKQSIDPKSEDGKRLQSSMDKNLVTYFRQEEKKQQEKKKQQENKQKDQGEQGKDPQEGNSDQKDQQGQSGDQKKPENKQDPKPGEDKEKKDKGDKGEEKKDPKDQDDKNKPEENKEQDGEGEEKKPAPPKKLEPKLKQLLNDDRQLQLKMIENGTRDLNKRKSRKSKDW